MIAKTKTSKTPARITETWRYAGRRRSAGKTVQAWADADGAILLYSKLAPSPCVGAAYTVQVDRSTDDRTVFGVPQFDDLDGSEPILEWNAADRLAAAAASRKTQERKGRSSDAITEQLAPLKRLYWSQRTSADRAAFLGMVIAELQGSR